MKPQILEDYDNLKADTKYQSPTIVGGQIRISRLSDIKRLFFKLDGDVNTSITISLDGGITSVPLKDIDGNQLTQLSKGYWEVVDNTTFFTLRPRGGDDRAFIGKYIPIPYYDFSYYADTLPQNSGIGWTRSTANATYTESVSNGILTCTAVANTSDMLIYTLPLPNISTSLTKIVVGNAKVSTSQGTAGAGLELQLCDGVKYISVCFKTDGTIYSYQTGGWTQVSAGNTLNQFFDFKITYDAVDGCKVYVAGILKATISYANWVANSNKKLDVLCRYDGGTTAWSLDYIKVGYNANIMLSTDTTLLTGVQAGQYVYSNEDVQLILDTPYQKTIDFSGVPIQSSVVGSAYLTSASARPQVLSNGWIVVLARNSGTNAIFYVSKDNGVTFSQLCLLGADPSAGFSLASYGTTVYCLFTQSAATQAYLIKFDATTVTNVAQTGYTYIDSNQTAFGTGCDIRVDSKGVLHAVWCSKNASYPSYFNIRYSKSTDGVVWATPTQITSDNSAYNSTEPCTIIKSDGYPMIIYKSQASYYYISLIWYNGTSWITNASSYIHSAGSNLQSSPSATVTSDGAIHVVWHGLDATEATEYNIHYSKSTDGGATWSAMLKLTTGNTYSQYTPCISCDINNKLYVIWRGRTAVSTGCSQIHIIKSDGSTWNTRSALTTATNDQMLPSVCDNYRSFQEPLIVWQDNQSAKVQFRGLIGTSRVPTDIVNSSYQTSATARPQVLSNGWMVNCLWNNTTQAFYWYVSKDGGITWAQLCYYPYGGGINGWSIASNGTIVSMIMVISVRVYCFTFDALFQGNVDIASSIKTVYTDSYSTGGGCDLKYDSNGVLHATWCSKTAAYQNSYNILYSKSTDNGNTWSAFTQLTTMNTTGYNSTCPVIAFKQDNNPFIAYVYQDTTWWGIFRTWYNGSAWSAPTYIYQVNNASYVQANPSVVTTSDGVIHVVWEGIDSTDTTYRNIRYSKSTDGGTTWSAPVKLTSGNSYNQMVPCITANIDNKLFVAWYGTLATGNGKYQIRTISNDGTGWGAINTVTNVTYGSSGAIFPSLCDNYKNFTEALMIYLDESSASVKFRGVFTSNTYMQIIPSIMNAISESQFITIGVGTLKTLGNALKRYIGSACRRSKGWS